MKKEYHRMKIIVAGDGGVGKTSLLNRYISNDFVECMLERKQTILVGTKADNTNVLDEETIKEFCIIYEIDEYIPTSAKTGENVDFVFRELIMRIIARKMSFGGVKNVEQSNVE